MRRALPVIAVSAAGLTWLLHAQGVIDSTTTGGSTSGGATAAPSERSGSPTTTIVGPVAPPTTSRRGTGSGNGSPTTTPPTTAGGQSGGQSGGGTATDGPVIDTRFGPVQVEAVITNGKLTDVKFLEYPNDARRSQQINNRAMPTLVQESLSAQSAQVDAVSGATYTSDAYTESLQAALDQAGFRH